MDMAFFARKFNVDLEDPVRGEIVKCVQEDLYNQRALEPFKDWMMK